MTGMPATVNRRGIRLTCVIILAPTFSLLATLSKIVLQRHALLSPQDDWDESSSGQMRLTPVDLAQCRPLVGVQVCVGVRVGDATSAGIIVVAWREF